MRSVYAPMSGMPCALPCAREDFTFSSCSSGPRNASKKSRNRPFARLMISRMSSCTSVLKTIGPHALRGAVALILRDRFLRLVNGGDEWQSHLSELHAVELRQQAVPHRLRGHAGLVGNEENGSCCFMAFRTVCT